jgi:hypothetical protein
MYLNTMTKKFITKDLDTQVICRIFVDILHGNEKRCIK